MQQVLKKKQSTPAIIEGVRLAVANAAVEPSKREIAAAKREQRNIAIRKLAESGMSQKQIAELLNVHLSVVAQNTRMVYSDEHKRELSVRAGRLGNQAYHEITEARKAYYIPIMLEFRALGYTNREIADKTGFSSATVKNYIGRQPDEITLMSIRVGAAKNRLRTKAVKMQTLREQAEQANLRLAGD